MGIDFDGGMIVGELGKDIPKIEELGEEFWEWFEDTDMSSYAQYYDADPEQTVFGFTVDDILVSELDDKWLEDIREKAAKFKELTGVDAKLIGTQNIW